MFPFPLSGEMGFDPGVFGRFDLAALVQPHLKFLFVCLLVCNEWLFVCCTLRCMWHPHWHSQVHLSIQGCLIGHARSMYMFVIAPMAN